MASPPMDCNRRPRPPTKCQIGFRRSPAVGTSAVIAMKRALARSPGSSEMMKGSAVPVRVLSGGLTLRPAAPSPMVPASRRKPYRPAQTSAGPRRMAGLRTAFFPGGIWCYYSITSSAAISRDCGTARSSILAVCALMTSSNLLACTTGKSAGFAPFRMRPT